MAFNKPNVKFVEGKLGGNMQNGTVNSDGSISCRAIFYAIQEKADLFKRLSKWSWKVDISGAFKMGPLADHNETWGVDNEKRKIGGRITDSSRPGSLSDPLFKLIFYATATFEKNGVIKDFTFFRTIYGVEDFVSLKAKMTPTECVETEDDIVEPDPEVSPTEPDPEVSPTEPDPKFYFSWSIIKAWFHKNRFWFYGILLSDILFFILGAKIF